MKTILLSGILTVSTLFAFAQTYYVVDAVSSNLYFMDKADGSTISTTAMTMDSGPVTGCGGMAIDPTDDAIYVIAKTTGGTRVLAELDLASASLTYLFDLDDKYAGLTFSGNGTCYAISGDGADAPSHLVEIDMTTGVITPLADLSDQGSDGESIAFNYANGLIYRYAGGNILQSIDPTDLSTLEFTITTEIANYGQALYYEAGNNTFTLAAGGTMHNIQVDGTEIGSVNATVGDDDGYKGIILDPEFVSVTEAEATPSVLIYPNPSNGQVNISNDEGITSITVSGLDGKIAFESMEVLAKELYLDLPSGVYIASVVLQNEAIEFHRIVIQ